MSVEERQVELRRNWQWAALCEFVHVFGGLLALPDISTADIEADLVHGADAFLPRIAHRLLFTLTYDRKISLDNWQNALRKQYDKRDPDANPLGPLNHPTANTSSVLKHDHKQPTAPSPAKNEPTPSADLPETAPVSPQPTPQPKCEPADDDQGTHVDPPDALPSEDQPPQPQPIDWSALPMLTKLRTLHTLAEWQFHNPLRLRQLMKSDDDHATWRREPVGYDRVQNAYWLIGGDRLWIQRMPPKPPSKKRKRPDASSLKKSSSKAKLKPKQKPAANKNKRRKVDDHHPTPQGRTSRAAKEQAKVKVAAQVRELAEYQRKAKAHLTDDDDNSMDVDHTPAPSHSRSTRSSRAAAARVAAPSPSRATRASARTTTARSSRLRNLEEDGWEQVPEEWLKPQDDTTSEAESLPAGRPTRASKRAVKPKPLPTVKLTLGKRKQDEGADSDGELNASDLSDLTDLSDDEEEGQDEEEEEQDDEEEDEHEEEEEKPDEGQKAVNGTTEAQGETKEEFVEWETLCVTLAEWLAFPSRFAESNHYLEKRFYKYLVNELVPDVTTELRAIEQKAAIEAAISHRKRSTRLAHKESEIAAQRAVEQKTAEEQEKRAKEDEKFARARRLEARQQREAEERERREREREARRERRERGVGSVNYNENDEDEGGDVDVEGGDDVVTKVARKKGDESDDYQDDGDDQEDDDDHEFEEEVLPARGANGRPRRAAAKPIARTASSSTTSAAKKSSGRARKPATNGARGSKSKSRRDGESDDWELDCEVCGRKGKNLEEDTPLLCCGRCSRWQHIQCHDKLDALQGRPRRDWDKTDFWCRRCLTNNNSSNNQQVHLSRHPPRLHTVSGVAPPQHSSHGSSHYQSQSRGSYQPYGQAYPSQGAYAHGHGQTQGAYGGNGVYSYGSGGGTWANGVYGGAIGVGGNVGVGGVSSSGGANVGGGIPGAQLDPAYGRTSSIRSSAYQASGYHQGQGQGSPYGYGGGVPGQVSFSHYHPQERAFSSGVNPGTAPPSSSTSYNPYMRNGYATDPKYQAYGSAYYPGAGIPTHSANVSAASQASPLPPPPPPVAYPQQPSSHSHSHSSSHSHGHTPVEGGYRSSNYDSRPLDPPRANYAPYSAASYAAAGYTPATSSSGGPGPGYAPAAASSAPAPATSGTGLNVSGQQQQPLIGPGSSGVMYNGASSNGAQSPYASSGSGAAPAPAPAVSHSRSPYDGQPPYSAQPQPVAEKGPPYSNARESYPPVASSVPAAAAVAPASPPPPPAAPAPAPAVPGPAAQDQAQPPPAPQI